jgi:2-polyprenyl-3-methyl-5-hydroxy-6-metoxy-1,4-benzoquinol methylase
VERDVLDAGCGTGEYSCWFAANGARITEIDLCDGSLSEARGNAQRAQLSGVKLEKRLFSI